MIAPPPLEQALVAYLNGELDEPVGTKVPTARPPAFVRLTSTGGAGLRELVLIDATVLFECWGATESLAWGLVAKVWPRVGTLAGASLTHGVYVNDVRSLQTPLNNPDSASGSPRYQFIATLTVALEETP